MMVKYMEYFLEAFACLLLKHNTFYEITALLIQLLELPQNNVLYITITYDVRINKYPINGGH